MKSEIFNSAIYNRRKIRFLYGMEEIIIDPYYISIDKSGKKVIYGKPLFSNGIKKFQFERIANIKILKKFKFSPIIPIISMVS